jgi:hypothetical protein
MRDKPGDVVGGASGVLLGNVERALGGLRSDLLLDLKACQYCEWKERVRWSSTLSDRSWMDISDVHDGSLEEETNLASEVGAHVCGWLVVDGRWVIEVVVDDKAWVWLAWVLERGCGCLVNGEKLGWERLIKKRWKADADDPVLHFPFVECWDTQVKAMEALRRGFGKKHPAGRCF